MLLHNNNITNRATCFATNSAVFQT